ncbi:MAG: S8 family serine peptidase [Bacteroidales bacterium]|nr:S8 family serine peptidase [Bacteroidales bacterium]
MKRLLLLVSILMLSLLGVLNAQTINPGYIDGHLYFKFNDDYDFRIKVNENTSIDFDQMPAEFTEMFERYGVTLITRPLYAFNDPKLERIIRLEFTDAQNIALFIKELELLEDVEYAEMVPYCTRKVTYNDPYYTSRTLGGIQYNFKWHLEMINAPQAWGIQQGSSNIKVAIVDNAVWGSHPDLQIASSNQCSVANGTASVGNSAPPSSVSQSTTCSEDDLYTNDNCPAYDWSHGTHCAGLVGAINNNGVGISSIGGGVTLMGVRAANNQDQMYYCMNGVTWAVQQGAKVVSMSYGSTQQSTSERTAFQTYYNNGVILVAAAGNEGDSDNSINYPGGYSTVISVASVNNNGKLSSFSQHGTGRADVAAPGGFVMYQNQEYMPNILSTTYCTSQMLRLFGLSLVNGEYYDGMQGTSMATPITAGLCGLLASAYPDITPAQAKQCLISTGTALASGSNTIDNNVYINAYAAVQCAQSYAGSNTLSVSPASLNYAVAGGSQTVTVTSNTSWTVTSSASWLTISPASGSNNGTITAVAAENTATSQRTATITVSGTDAPTQTISVTQAGTSGGGETGDCVVLHEDRFTSNPSIYTVEDGGYVFGSNSYGDQAKAELFELSGNYNLTSIDYLYAIDGSSGSVTFKVWANSNGTPGSELATKTVTMSELYNAGTSTGSGNTKQGLYTWTLTSPVAVSSNFFAGIDVSSATSYIGLASTAQGSGYSNSNYELYNGSWGAITTSWQGLDASMYVLPTVCPTSTPSYNLTVNPSSLSYTAAGESKTVTITSNTSWTATSSASWLTVSPASGSNNGTITAVATANTSSSQRTATITVSGTGVNAQTISVTQAGTNSGGDAVSLFTYDFEACTAWTVDQFSPCTTYDGDGSATYTIEGSTFTNQGYTGAYIAFENGIASSFAAHGGTKFGCCMAATTPPNNDWFITPAISISNGTTFSFWARSATNSYGLEQFKVGISSNNTSFNTYLAGSASTTVSAPVEWTQYTYDLSQYAGQTMYIAIMCVSNDVFAFFIDDIEVSSSSTPSYNLTVNPSSLSYTAAGESKTVTVTSNTSWTATSSATWLTVSPASGSNNGTITAVASANTSSSQRTATITISGSGITRTVSVTQAGVSYNLTVNPTSLSYTAAGESKTVTVTSNTSWTATSSASWLTVSPASGSNNGTITAVAAANSSTSQRTTTITVSGSGITRTINVTQAGATTAIDEEVAEGISVYPNPTSGMFTVGLGAIEGKATCQIVNANGSIIETREVNADSNSEIVFDCNVNSGVYFVRIISGNNVWTKRVIIEK